VRELAGAFGDLGVDARGALDVADWLVSHDAPRIIEDSGVDRHGGPLVFPSSDHWRTTRPRS
jgi:hypothetical protein